MEDSLTSASPARKATIRRRQKHPLAGVPPKTFKGKYRQAYGLFRMWRDDCIHCASLDILPSSAEVFRNAALAAGLDQALACQLAEACFCGKRTEDDRLHELHDHVTGCIEVAREQKATLRPERSL